MHGNADRRGSDRRLYGEPGEQFVVRDGACFGDRCSGCDFGELYGDGGGGFVCLDGDADGHGWQRVEDLRAFTEPGSGAECTELHDFKLLGCWHGCLHGDTDGGGAHGRIGSDVGQQLLVGYSSLFRDGCSGRDFGKLLGNGGDGHGCDDGNPDGDL